MSSKNAGNETENNNKTKTRHRDSKPNGKNHMGFTPTPSTDNKVLHDMAIQKVRDNMEEMKTSIVEEVNEQMQDFIALVTQQIQQMNTVNEHLFEDEQILSNRKKSDKEGGLPEKEFLARNSLLTDLFDIKHIRTLYHIFIVILIIMFLNTVVYDFVADGKINFGQDLILIGFGKFQTVLLIWLAMQASTLVVYVCFSFWAHRRAMFKPKSMALRCWDYTWLLILFAYQCAFVWAPTKALLEEDLPPASSIIILMEQIRFLMKSHAFVRSNGPRALAYKPHSDAQSPCPGFSNYLYFLFVPTLVYRDSYPRTKQIRWKKVVWCYIEVVGVVFYVGFIFERFMLHFFRPFGKQSLEPGAMVLSMFGCMMPGTLAFLCGFYCLLHSWMNASAEMLTFADRMFYKDWWNSSSFSTYYRTWNVVVHDWLYTYIYKDMYEIVVPKNKLAATLVVFMISAVFHEYILAFAFRFFYPAMFIFFGGFGVLLVFITKKEHKAAGNILMWLLICVGNGLLLSLYCMEYYSRINCPSEDDSIWEHFVPRSWTCHGLTSNPNWAIRWN